MATGYNSPWRSGSCKPQSQPRLMDLVSIVSQLRVLGNIVNFSTSSSQLLPPEVYGNGEFKMITVALAANGAATITTCLGCSTAGSTICSSRGCIGSYKWYLNSCINVICVFVITRGDNLRQVTLPVVNITSSVFPQVSRRDRRLRPNEPNHTPIYNRRSGLYI